MYLFLTLSNLYLVKTMFFLDRCILILVFSFFRKAENLIRVSEFSFIIRPNIMKSDRKFKFKNNIHTLFKTSKKLTH